MKRLLILLAALPLFASAAERIITLGGDVTEIVYALDAQPQLVARDSTSTWPAASQSLPDVGYLRQLNAEGILSLRPTLVLISADGLKGMGGEVSLWKLPGLAQTPAGRNKQVLVIDDMALLGFGPRTPQALMALRQKAEQTP